MLSRIRVADARITQLRHGTLNPGVPTVLPPFFLFFHKTTENCHIAMAVQTWPCRRLRLRLRWLLTTPNLSFSPVEGRGLHSDKASCQHHPWTQMPPRWQANGYSVPRAGTFLQGAREWAALCCFPAPPAHSGAKCPVGISISFTHRLCLKPSESPASPSKNGNLTVSTHLIQADNFLLHFYTQTWSHHTLLLAARKFLPLAVLKTPFPS